MDKDNGDTRQQDAILQEMKNVRLAVEAFEGNKGELPIEFQQITCRMIIDIKLGENFRRKARLSRDTTDEYAMDSGVTV